MVKKDKKKEELKKKKLKIIFRYWGMPYFIPTQDKIQTNMHDKTIQISIMTTS